ncbi:hypothetical protein KUV47_02160 [Vannielia litorea]|uniref:DUF6985 domain-containing protein n=1 Tax=Vannielia litorea TaxID=1217970 RepID=UPI001C9388DC|nr:hypothetical protein [Vannielia litorea]MBY6152003.1 hypothetical protein [Vannielia litorea]
MPGIEIVSEPLAVPYFDGTVVDRDIYIDHHQEPSPEQAARALAAFARLTPADRLADSLHVYNYYRDFHQDVGGEEWLDEEMGVPAAPEEIWQHVTPGTVHLVIDPRHPDHVYVVMSAKCVWEEEHGLMMIWEDGARLTKVGGYDGHVTNETAYDRPEYKGIVYKANDPALTTRL